MKISKRLHVTLPFTGNKNARKIATREAMGDVLSNHRKMRGEFKPKSSNLRDPKLISDNWDAVGRAK